VLLSEARILAAYLIFLSSYFVFALGKFPWMKIDRPGAAIIGAVLMVAFRIVGPQEALESINFATIVLLFSMMLVVANLRVGGSSSESQNGLSSGCTHITCFRRSSSPPDCSPPFSSMTSSAW
jgi:di/tricarboxylate transporter